MKLPATRREFVKGVAMSAAAATLSSSLLAMRQRHIQIGHTGITWRNSDMETAISDVSSLGFYGFETFGNVFDMWEEKPGALGAPLKVHNLPLISAYCNFNLTDPSKLKDEVAKGVRWAGIVKKYGGRFIVVGPNPVHRDSYDFAANKANIVAALNDICRAVADAGLPSGLHQHTGTCVETRDETYAVMDAVNTKYVRFSPDIGQLTKGGSDPVQVVKDHLSIVEHMHMKDYDGKDTHMAGYCPLGKGKVNVPAILDLVKHKKLQGMVMVELDYDNRESFVPLELAKTSKEYLVRQGVNFRA